MATRLVALVGCAFACLLALASRGHLGMSSPRALRSNAPAAPTPAAALRSRNRRRLEAEPPDPFASAAFVAPATKETCAEGTKRTYVAWKKVSAAVACV